MANLLVRTTNQDEKTRLQQQFYVEHEYFKVPTTESATLEAIFRSISFQYFQNSPTPLVQKIITFAENSINSICSLDLLREIIVSIKLERDSLILYRRYFAEMNQQLAQSDSSQSQQLINDSQSLAEENDVLFDLAQKGEIRLTRFLDCNQYQEEQDYSLKHHCPQAISEKTQVPSMHRITSYERQVEESQEPNNLSNILNSAENYYGNQNQWWKQEKHGSDSSKQISKFDCKAGTPLHQKSIGRLVVQQLKYDLNREMQLGRDINKHQQVEGFKYKKMMKDKLLSAKLKKRRKK